MKTLGELLAEMWGRVSATQTHPAGINRKPVEAVMNEGRYLIDGKPVTVTGRNPGFAVGDTVPVATTETGEAVVVGHQMLKAQFHPTGELHPIVEELWVKDTGKLGFRSAEEEKEIDLSEFITWTPEAVKWGDNDNEFVVAGADSGKGYMRFASFEIARPAEHKTKRLPDISLMEDLDLSLLALDLGTVTFHEERTTEHSLVIIKQMFDRSFGNYSAHYAGYEVRENDWTDIAEFNDSYSFMLHDLFSGAISAQNPRGAHLTGPSTNGGLLQVAVEDFWLDATEHILVHVSLSFSGYNFYARGETPGSSQQVLRGPHVEWPAPGLPRSDGSPQLVPFDPDDPLASVMKTYESDDYFIGSPGTPEIHAFLIDLSVGTLLYRSWGEAPTVGGTIFESGFDQIYQLTNNDPVQGSPGTITWMLTPQYYFVPGGNVDIPLPGPHKRAHFRKTWLHDTNAPFVEEPIIATPLYSQPTIFEWFASDDGIVLTANKQFFVGPLQLTSDSYNVGSAVGAAYPLTPSPIQTHWRYSIVGFEKSEGSQFGVIQIKKQPVTANLSTLSFPYQIAPIYEMPADHFQGAGASTFFSAPSHDLHWMDLSQAGVASLAQKIRGFTITEVDPALSAVTKRRIFFTLGFQGQLWQYNLDTNDELQLDLDNAPDGAVAPSEFFIMAPDFTYDRERQNFLALNDEDQLIKDVALQRVDALQKIEQLPTYSDIHAVNDPRTLRRFGRYEPLTKA